MPTYDYQCTSCKYKFEHFQKISDPHLTECPQCKKDSLKRLTGGGAGLQFKGSGFYITDYKNHNENSKPACHKDGGCGCKKP